MGWKLKKINVNLCENEEKNVNLVLSPERKAAVTGTVIFPNGAPVRNALVKLYRRSHHNPHELVPVTFSYTDEKGEFQFGVLANVDYVIKATFYVPE